MGGREEGKSQRTLEFIRHLTYRQAGRRENSKLPKMRLCGSYYYTAPSSAIGMIAKVVHDSVFVSTAITARLNTLLPLCWIYSRCASSMG
jgi:hypothetical protein